MKYDVEEEGIELGSVVNKESNTGLMSNKRLLVLKSGCLYYYSTVPKAFKGDLKILKSLKDTPKSSIDIAYIHHIKADQKQPLQFEIQFEAKHMMGTQDIRKTMTNQDYNFAPKNTNELVKWRFSCETKDLRDRWVSSLNASIKESIDIMKFMRQMNGEKVEEAPAGRKSVIPWKNTDQSDQQKKAQEKKKQQEEARKKQEEEDKQKRLEQQRKEHEQRKKQDLEMKKKLEKARKQRQREEKQRQAERLEKERLARQAQLVEQTKSNLTTPKFAEVETTNTTQSNKKEETEATIPQPIVSTDRPNNQEEGFEPIRPPVVPQLAMQKLTHVMQEERFDKSVSNESRQFQQSRPHPPLQSPNTDTKRIQPIEEYTSTLSISPEKLASWNSENLRTPEQSPLLKHTSKSQIEEYYSLTNSIFEGSFRDKIQRQLEQRKLSLAFRDRAADVFEEIINELMLEPSKRTFLLGQPPVRSMQFENMHFKLGMTTSKKVKIDATESYFFDSEEQKLLKRQFEAYSNAEQFITNLRRQGQQLRIRVPLICLIEYKGVTGLVSYINNQESDVANQQDVQEVAKELRQIGLNENNFSCRLLSSTNNFIIYLKSTLEISRKPPHHEILTGPVTSEYMHSLQASGYSLSLRSLVACHEKLLGQPLTPRNKEVINSLEYCIYCKALRKIYRAGQAEIDELSFWRLVFSRDPTLTKMIVGAGCEYIPQHQGILLDYVRFFCGAVFQFDKLGDLSSVNRATARPLTKALIQRCTQLEDSIENFPKYLKEQKYELARETLELKRQLCQSKFEQTKQVLLLVETSELQHRQGDIIESIRLCKKALDQLSQSDPMRLRIYSQLFKNNEDSSQTEMFRLFKQAIDLTILNYGSQHSSLVDLYCILAFYLDSKRKDYASAVQVYNNALKLAEQIYGDDSKEVAAILVDVSQFHRGHGRTQEANKCLGRASKLYMNLSSTLRSNKGYIKFLLYSAKCLAAANNQPLANNYISEAMRLVQSHSDPLETIEAYKAAFEVYSALRDNESSSEILNRMFMLGLSSDLKYARYCLERCLDKSLKETDPNTKAKLAELSTSTKKAECLPTESLGILASKRQGYRGIFQFVDDLLSCLLSDRVTSKTAEVQYTGNLVLFQHFLNILNIGYLLNGHQ